MLDPQRPTACGPVTLIGIQGRELAAQLQADKAAILSDEPLCLTFGLALMSGPPCYLHDGGDYRNRFGRAENYRVTVTDANGRILPVRDPGSQTGGMLAARALSETKGFEKRVLLAHWVRFEKPGRYQLSVETELKLLEQPDTRHPSARTPACVSLTIEVLPSSFAALGAVIDDLGSRMLEPRSRTWSREGWRSLEGMLATIEDERVVPYYSGLLQGEPSERFVAIRRLLAFGCDEAFEGIRKALSDPRYQTYENIRNLGDNAHPGALELCWSFRNHEDRNLRLAVLQGVQRNNPEDRAERVRLFLDDPDEGVRAEAELFS